VNPTLVRDLDQIIEAAADDLRSFAGARLYVTGGSGFVGTWMLRTIAHANRRLEAAIHVEVLTRSPEDALRRAPDLSEDPNINLVRGDICAPVSDGAYDAVIHAATPPATHPDIVATTIDSARALIHNVISPSGDIPVLLTSSGAVYGRQPPKLIRIPETFMGGPDILDPQMSYHESKRVAELFFANAQAAGQGRAKIARLFAFLGPGLPLDAHYAAGNFINDLISRRPICIKGDGTPYRSYLYPTDMIVWMLAVFARGQDSRAYNIGSEESITIRDLARTIAATSDPPTAITITKAEVAATTERYVPDTTRIRDELGVQASLGLEEIIDRTLRFHRSSA
jgi:dTDP-glucose 4,6-dehydratase